MKKQVQAFVQAQGHTTHYSGKTKTMFITGSNAEDYVELAVIGKFGTDLPFKLSNQPVRAEYTKQVNKYSKAYLKSKAA